MKRAAATALGGFTGGFGTLLFFVVNGNDHTPPPVLLVSAFGAVFGAIVGPALIRKLAASPDQQDSAPE